MLHAGRKGTCYQKCQLHGSIPRTEDGVRGLGGGKRKGLGPDLASAG